MNGPPISNTSSSSVWQAKGAKQIGEEAWKKMEKTNGELFALTYGALVAQLLMDQEDGEAVNRELDRIGYNIGIRLIDEYIARNSFKVCIDSQELAESISKVALKQFLNTTAAVKDWSADGREFTLAFEADGGGGPGLLGMEWVELPEQAIGTLQYGAMLPGVIRGALEMIQLQVECAIVYDLLRSGEKKEGTVMELRIKIVRRLDDAAPPDDED